MEVRTVRQVLCVLCVGGLAWAAETRYPDVVTTDRDGVWVFPGSAQGTYADGVFYQIGTSVEPWHVTLADLNGDSLPDIVSANRLGPFVSVFLNKGDGFEGPFNYQSGNVPYATAAGDFDGDGDLDLAVANPESGGTLRLLRNDGDGAFVSWDNLHPGNGVYAVECADVDSDGKADLVIVCEEGDDVVVLLGNGNGGFLESARHTVEQTPKSLALGRFNDDALPDIAVVNSDSATISTLINTGGGTFRYVDAFAAGAQPRHIVACDLDADGSDDLVVAGGRGSDQVFVLMGQGDGRFATAAAYSTGPRPNAVAAADVDADGRLDILAANWALDNETAACVSVLHNSGDATFEKALDFKPAQGFPKLTFVTAGYLRVVRFLRGDVNRDGRVNISDPIKALHYLFGLAQVTCVDAVDVNDNGIPNIADAIVLLSYLFGGGVPPAAPFPTPGADPTADNLSCR